MLIGVDASRATAARPTGTELYSLRLIEALLELKTEHRFRLYFRASPADGEIGIDRTTVRAEYRTIPFPRLWSHVRLGLEIAVQRPDVLFVPSHVLPVCTRVPAVVTVHDLGYVHFPEAHPARQRWYLDWSTRHNARVARRIIADSQATKRDLVRLHSVKPDKVIVAYPGFDARLAPVTKPGAIAAVKRRHGIDDNYFLHIGTLQPRKNLDRLIKAFAQLPNVREVQLVLAGKQGWLYEELFLQVRRLNLEKRVRFPGFVTDDEKAALLSGAIAYVFPSLYEGFGLPTLEANACETPLICANTSSLPEVAGDSAVFVDPTDIDNMTEAMQRVASDAGLRASLVERGRKNLKRFSWQSCAQTVLQTLETAAGAVDN